MGHTILLIASYLFSFYSMLIIVYIISSWIPPLRESKIMIIVVNLVEPYLGFFRKFIPPIGMIDFSPIIAILAYNYIKIFALNGLAKVLEVLGIN